MKALSLLKEAVKEDSEFAMAYRRIWTMRAFLPDGDSAAVKAVRYQSRLSERERLAVDGSHYTALYLFPDADRNRAVQAYEKLAAMGDPLGMNNLPEVLNNMREYARAESLDRINVARFPNEPAMRDGLIHRLIELNRLDDAEHEMDEALKQFPQQWGIQWWKIRTLYYRGHLDAFERALDSLSKESDLNKRRVAMNMRAEMALMRGRLKERERLVAEARTLSAATGDQAPQTPLQVALEKTKNELWLAFMRQRDNAALVQHWDELQQLAPAPKDAQEAFNIAVVFANEGRRPDIARRYLDRFVASVPDSLRDRQGDGHFIHWARFFIAVAENRPREAIEERWLGDRFRDGFPGPCHLCLYRDLALAYDKAGDADSTILLLERFVNEPSSFTLNTHPGDVHNYLRRLGELYEQKGNRQKAIDYYSRFVELWKNADPDLQPQVADIRARITRLKS